MKCADCKHDQHDSGECKKCNCGSSEVIHKTPMSGGFWVFDKHARIHTSGGRRVFEAPRAA